MSVESFVYVVGGSNGPQKIGISSDPRRRLSALQSASHDTLRQHSVTSVPSEMAAGIERLVHWRMRDRHVRGEWFQTTPDEASGIVRECVEGYSKGERAPQKIVDKERTSRFEDAPWQVRAKRAGLSQKLLAHLLGVAENTVSLQLRGKWQSGIPVYVKTVIRSWEMLRPEEKERIIQAANEEAALRKASSTAHQM